MSHVGRIMTAVVIVGALAAGTVASRPAETRYRIDRPTHPAAVDAVGPLVAASAPAPAPTQPAATPTATPAPTAGLLAATPSNPTPTARTSATPRILLGSIGADQGESATKPPPDDAARQKDNSARAAGLGRAEARLLELMNAERAADACPPLQVDRALNRAAGKHSADMAARAYFSITEPGGQGPADRARAEGYPGTTAENIAMDVTSPAAALASWLNDGSAKENVVSCRTTTVGIGVARARSGTTYWTVDFGVTLDVDGT